jgi:hypothetical protein
MGLDCTWPLVQHPHQALYGIDMVRPRAVCLASVNLIVVAEYAAETGNFSLARFDSLARSLRNMVNCHSKLHVVYFTDLSLPQEHVYLRQVPVK